MHLWVAHPCGCVGFLIAVWIGPDLLSTCTIHFHYCPCQEEEMEALVPQVLAVCFGFLIGGCFSDCTVGRCCGPLVYCKLLGKLVHGFWKGRQSTVINRKCSYIWTSFKKEDSSVTWNLALRQMQWHRRVCTSDVISNCQHTGIQPHSWPGCRFWPWQVFFWFNYLMKFKNMRACMLKCHRKMATRSERPAWLQGRHGLELENESWDLLGYQFSYCRILMDFQVSVVGITTGCSLIVLILVFHGFGYVPWHIGIWMHA